MTEKDWWLIGVPSAITVIGFLITYYSANKKITEELNFYKRSNMINGLKDCLDELSHLFDSVKDQEYDDVKHNNLMSNIYAYGSKEAISIATYWQQSSYNKTADVYVIFSCITLLISQVKYDITAEKLKPNMLFKLRLTDYTKDKKYKKAFDSKINEIVNALELNKYFLIDD